MLVREVALYGSRRARTVRILGPRSVESSPTSAHAGCCAPFSSVSGHVGPHCRRFDGPTATKVIRQPASFWRQPSRDVAHSKSPAAGRRSLQDANRDCRE